MLSKEVWPCCLCTVHHEVMVLMCSKQNNFSKFCFIGKLKCRSSLEDLRVTVCYSRLGSLHCQTGSVTEKIRDMFYLSFQSGSSRCQGAREEQNGSCSKGRSHDCSAINGRSRREWERKLTLVRSGYEKAKKEGMLTEIFSPILIKINSLCRP